MEYNNNFYYLAYYLNQLWSSKAGDIASISEKSR